MGMVIGIVLTYLSHLRWGSALLAWVYPVPFLLMALQYKKHKVTLAVTLCTAWTAVFSKIVTHPVPFIMALVFGILVGLMFFSGYVLWEYATTNDNEQYNNNHKSSSWVKEVSFACAMVFVEWVQSHYTPLGSWGAATYTQYANLPLLQSVSLVGMAGPAFLMYWFAAILAIAIHEQKTLLVMPMAQQLSSPKSKNSNHSLLVWGVIVTALCIWGSIRLDDVSYKTTVTVAGVGTDATFGGMPLPSQDEIEVINKNLFVRSETAAKAGAKLISWTEGATLVFPGEDEQSLHTKGVDFANEYDVELVMAYIVPVELDPLQYENKVVWIRPDGTIDHEYLKAEPVPSEPAIRGDGIVKVVQTKFGRAAAAICYDYDFPYIGRKHANEKIAIAIVPSSDWLGIDPTHTQMAAVRAIEGGYAMLRTTRMGLSAGINRNGQMLAQLSANQSDERIMIVNLPLQGENISTVYTIIGDSFVYLCLIFLIVSKMIMNGRIKTE